MEKCHNRRSTEFVGGHFITLFDPLLLFLKVATEPDLNDNAIDEQDLGGREGLGNLGYSWKMPIINEAFLKPIRSSLRVSYSFGEVSCVCLTEFRPLSYP